MWNKVEFQLVKKSLGVKISFIYLLDSKDNFQKFQTLYDLQFRLLVLVVRFCWFLELWCILYWLKNEFSIDFTNDFGNTVSQCGNCGKFLSTLFRKTPVKSTDLVLFSRNIFHVRVNCSFFHIECITVWKEQNFLCLRFNVKSKLVTLLESQNMLF